MALSGSSHSMKYMKTDFKIEAKNIPGNFNENKEIPLNNNGLSCQLEK